MKKIELNDILKYRFLSGVRYSPNEKCAAFVLKYADEKKNSYPSFIYVVEGGKVRQLTGLGKEGRFFFEDDENILFVASRSDEEKESAKVGCEETNYYRINIHGGEAVKAFTLPFSGSISERIDKTRFLINGHFDIDYPDYYKMTAKERKEVAEKVKEEKDYQVVTESPFYFNGAGYVNKKRSGLYIYDMKTKKTERITDDKFDVSDSIILNGYIYYMGGSFTVVRPRNPQIYKYDLKTGKTVCLNFGEELKFGGLTVIDNKLIVLGNDEKKHGLNQDEALYTIDESTGKLTKFFEPDRSYWDSVGTDCALGGGRNMIEGEKLHYISTRRNASEIFSLDKSAKEKAVTDFGGAITCFDVTKDAKEFLFVAFMGQALEELYRLKNGKITKLTHFNDSMLKGRYVAVPEKITIQSEGFDIDGWVLKPIDYNPKKKYPAILEVHGGPKTVYGEIFHHEMQVFASEGYFVFFCNPVGSDGRGGKFADIRGHYGDHDFKNIMDFTDAVLKKYPQIDPKRVGVTGGSYGGFMTNWIVGHTDRFACAATQRSISNWISFHGVSDIGPFFATDQTAGNIEDKVKKMWEQSPLKYADNVKTPLLFIHSDEDYRCPLSQGMQFYTALANKGQIVRMCIFHGENHELSRSGKPKHRIRRLTEIYNWMKEYLGR